MSVDIVVIVVIVATVVIVVIVVIVVKNKKVSLAELINHWQGHLLSCPGQLKILPYLPDPWKQNENTNAKMANTH